MLKYQQFLQIYLTPEIGARLGIQTYGIADCIRHKVVMPLGILALNSLLVCCTFQLGLKENLYMLQALKI
jgi:hypothetical protein